MIFFSSGHFGSAGVAFLGRTYEANSHRYRGLQVCSLRYLSSSLLFTEIYRGIGLAVTRHLLHKFNANVVAISRTRTQELIDLHTQSLLVIECDVLVNVLISCTFPYFCAVQMKRR